MGPRGGPPKVQFRQSPKMAFSGIPVSGLCRGSEGLPRQLNKAQQLGMLPTIFCFRIKRVGGHFILQRCHPD